jgi:hypothetical protein
VFELVPKVYLEPGEDHKIIAKNSDGREFPLDEEKTIAELLLHFFIYTKLPEFIEIYFLTKDGQKSLMMRTGFANLRLAESDGPKGERPPGKSLDEGLDAFYAFLLNTYDSKQTKPSPLVSESSSENLVSVGVPEPVGAHS